MVGQFDQLRTCTQPFVEAADSVNRHYWIVRTMKQRDGLISSFHIFRPVANHMMSVDDEGAVTLSDSEPVTLADQFEDFRRAGRRKIHWRGMMHCLHNPMKAAIVDQRHAGAHQAWAAIAA